MTTETQNVTQIVCRELNDQMMCVIRKAVAASPFNGLTYPPSIEVDDCDDLFRFSGDVKFSCFRQSWHVAYRLTGVRGRTLIYGLEEQ